jgi:SAM-dependent methyltransferase
MGVGSGLRTWFHRLPPDLRERARRSAHRLPAGLLAWLGAETDRPPGMVRWGDLRRGSPFNRAWGFGRGTPIDRIYIENFLARHADDVRGVCLEVLNADYTRRFGGIRVTRSDVLDVNPANTAATIVADLGEPRSVPGGRFDCVIFTQTLHLVPDMRAAVENVWHALAPGGVLLLTVPALGRHEAREGFHHDRWRVTGTGREWLFAGLGARVDVVTYGNVLVCAAFLYGLGAEELSAAELDAVDREFPLIVAARAVREVVP